MTLQPHEKQAILVAAHHLDFLLYLHEVCSPELSNKLKELRPLFEKEMGKISENAYCRAVNHGFALLNLMCNRW